MLVHEWSWRPGPELPAVPSTLSSSTWGLLEVGAWLCSFAPFPHSGFGHTSPCGWTSVTSPYSDGLADLSGPFSWSSL